ncbi:DUF6876 family protein [Flavobacterium aquatile]|uniref:DUF6876 domain-containing protein n=1 Tax=Flavobacterium aquatile LMG 4008 = ATCC 11947 TaxID=1453498 RepID=A0A095U4Q6_9FLAO|nr:DUF6876 family protein [Flavobacterium aquatile]KGD69603.1 hypothetical protein LG45_02270 [Flavobacterium aquatile LMG 4008 = ATCC 11947]OXA67258.1 hypothetical protein B0A61_08610 [Flavobacterium aquatile LMG 4008 = ATCC 11947]GEC77916.1 hypothetical protein FAQ01_07860 [Flavobacterium aquatile]
MKDTITKTDLAQFTGTENWYRHPIARTVLYTDGIQYLAEKAGAYWLIDEIAFNQIKPNIKKEEFQTWTLRVDLEKSTAALTCDDGNNNIVFSKKIEYTDFPLQEIRIFFVNNVILLPSEY